MSPTLGRAAAGQGKARRRRRMPRTTSALRDQCAAKISVTGKPSRELAIAGASTSARLLVPKRVSSASQPATAPGTVAE